MCDVITLQVESAPDSSGKAQPPSLFATSYAFVRALSAREIDKAQQVAQEVTHLVKIPYLAGVKEAMLVVHDGRTFRIEGVEDPDERKVELWLYALEVGQNA